MFSRFGVFVYNHRELSFRIFPKSQVDVLKDYEQKKATKKFAEYWKDRGYEKAAEPIV